MLVRLPEKSRGETQHGRSLAGVDLGLADMGTQDADRDIRREEFVRLFQQHERSLYGYILSLVANVAAADEVSQNTNLVLWEEFDRFDPGTDFRSWARTIAYYQVLTYRKSRNRERVRFNSELLEVLADRAAVRSEELATRQSHLVDCLMQLNEFKRQVMRMYCCLGMTIKAVAKQLGRSTAAVEKTVVRTRQTLSRCVEAAMRREDHR
jgi:RNA polymerase sigma-70 factor (ECF subfamily)